MKAEQLLVLASARGMRLDLARPKRDIPWHHKRPPRRRDARAPTEDSGGDPGIPGVLSAEGRQTSSSRAPAWEPADLGFACAGMPDRSWRTLCWAIGLEEPARAWLKAQLLLIAVELKERQHWPDKFKRGTCPFEVAPGVRCAMQRCTSYLEDLCELALIELAEPVKFQADTLRAQCFGVAAHAWIRHLRAPYQELVTHTSSWFSSAIGYINRRLTLRDSERGAA